MILEKMLLRLFHYIAMIKKNARKLTCIFLLFRNNILIKNILKNLKLYKKIEKIYKKLLYYVWHNTL